MRQRGSGVLHQRRRSRVVLPDRQRRVDVASAGPGQTGMGCTVRTPCLERALASGQEAGVWGGASEPERRAVLRFAFYGRVSTEDWQDPVTSRARQLAQAAVLVA